MRNSTTTALRPYYTNQWTLPGSHAGENYPLPNEYAHNPCICVWYFLGDADGRRRVRIHCIEDANTRCEVEQTDGALEEEIERYLATNPQEEGIAAQRAWRERMGLPL
jgi:hypothetical protein